MQIKTICFRRDINNNSYGKDVCLNLCDSFVLQTYFYVLNVYCTVPYHVFR